MTRLVYTLYLHTIIETKYTAKTDMILRNIL